MAWLAVSSKAGRKKRDWWCFPSNAQIGDLVFVYQKQKGVYRIERVSGKPRAKEIECSEVGLLTANTVLLKEFAKPVEFKTIKHDPLLSNMKGVSRSFQGTTFPVGEEEAKKLVALLEQVNR